MLTEIEQYFIKCIVFPIVGTLLVANSWLLFIQVHDLIHFFSDSVTQCIHSHYYNLIIYNTGISMLFSVMFFKKIKEVINAHDRMIKEHYHKKPHTHLLLNMIMIQLTTGFIDVTVYQIIKSKYESNNCDQIYDSFFVIHQMFNLINIISMCVYFCVFIVIIMGFFFAFLLTLFESLNSQVLQTHDNTMYRIGNVIKNVITCMDEIVARNF